MSFIDTCKEHVDGTYDDAEKYGLSDDIEVQKS